MFNLIKRHVPNLATILLILMLVIPFALYYFAQAGSDFGVNLFLVVMGLVMLAAIRR